LYPSYIEENQFTLHALRITPDDLLRFNCCTLSFTTK